jgi:hypothetical protein
VAAQHRRLADRHVVLEVRPPELDVRQHVVPASLDEQARLLEVSSVPGHAVQLDKGRFDLGVTADGLDALLPEHVAHEIRGARRDGKQTIVSARTGALPSRGGLEQVPEAVQLVAPGEVCPALLLPGPAEPGAEVAIGLLRCGHTVDDGTKQGFQVVAAAAPDLPRERLEVLVDLGVRELPPATTRRQAAIGCEVEV